MQDLARQHHMALIVPIYELEQEGVYYNTAAVIRQRPENISANIARPTFRTWRRAFGRNFISVRATWAIPFSTWASRKSASTSATTAIFPKARARWD